MIGADAVFPGEIRNRPGHLVDAVVRAGAQRQASQRPIREDDVPRRLTRNGAP